MTLHFILLASLNASPNQWPPATINYFRHSKQRTHVNDNVPVESKSLKYTTVDQILATRALWSLPNNGCDVSWVRTKNVRNNGTIFGESSDALWIWKAFLKFFCRLKPGTFGKVIHRIHAALQLLWFVHAVRHSAERPRTETNAKNIDHKTPGGTPKEPLFVLFVDPFFGWGLRFAHHPRFPIEPYW